jgi:hypothetical protein
MDLQMVFFDFLRPVAFGTVGVLAGLALLGWSMPSRAKVNARPTGTLLTGLRNAASGTAIPEVVGQSSVLFLCPCG